MLTAACCSYVLVHGWACDTPTMNVRENLRPFKEPCSWVTITLIPFVMYLTRGPRYMGDPTVNPIFSVGAEGLEPPTFALLGRRRTF